MSPITQKNVNHVDINWQQYKDVNSELTESSVHQIWVYSSGIEMKCNSSVVSKANSSTSLHFTECIQSDIAKKTFIFENHFLRIHEHHIREDIHVLGLGWVGVGEGICLETHLYKMHAIWIRSTFNGLTVCTRLRREEVISKTIFLLLFISVLFNFA